MQFTIYLFCFLAAIFRDTFHSHVKLRLRHEHMIVLSLPYIKRGCPM
jgi:hypothetical protein